ncbi:MAG: 50S ribosomal protein L1 [Victivallaceae bacterium]|nr:50S ribosomal protein L1 [Victivallaceae bacterium]
MPKRGKKYSDSRKKVERQKRHDFIEAVQLAIDASYVKFDETVDIAVRLGVDPRHADQMVRGTVVLPNGIGKEVKVLVFAKGEKEKEALDAEADFVGNDDLIEKIKGGWLDFDVLIATPEAMKQVRPLGRVLGPRGLMPNPKTGTVTDAVGEAVKEAKFGRVEYRADKGACVHVAVGKLSFSAEDLKENFDALLNVLVKARPATAKGAYFISCTISSTMSPGIKISNKEIERH